MISELKYHCWNTKRINHCVESVATGYWRSATTVNDWNLLIISAVWSLQSETLKLSTFSLIFFFLPARRYAWARSLLSKDGWLDGCPSHACIVSKQLNQLLQLLWLSGSPVILVFWPLASLPNSNGNPFSGGR